MIDQDHDLISRCLRKEVAAEYQLYRRFAAKMYGICLRYGGDEMEAEDILQLGFVRLFQCLHQFKFEGSFDGWVHRIFVTTAINYYRKNLKFIREVDLTEAVDAEAIQEDVLSAITTRELLEIIQNLPIGYRTVFNMYVIENYRHQEIANLLGISVGTSKSQLHLAKSSIKRILESRNK